MKTINKMKKYIFSKKKEYLNSLSKSVNEYEVLLEAGQGKNINGNMFAILKEIELQSEWEKFQPFFVVTEDTKDKARKRFESYGFNKVKLVIRDGKEYQEKLARCKYLITDNSFPTYFIKREDQIYLNTWHGTPLKYLGRSDIKNGISLGNIQKNYFACDYALFPNEHTKNVFMQDYMLDKMFKGNILMADYPRNVSLLDKNAACALKKKLDLSDKMILAYMPTWRGTGRVADSKKQIKIISEKLKEIDARLLDNQILFVNLHFLVSEALDFEEFIHIKQFPDEYETYEFLNVCDVLITDYSSVFFDFAVTDKKIILYAYDRKEYLKDKGMYLEMESLPFPIVEDIDSLIKEINSEKICISDEFKQTYCKYADQNGVNKILKLLFYGEKQNLTIEKIKPDHKKKIMFHIGNINDPVLQRIVNVKLEELDFENNDIILVFEDGINFRNMDFLDALPKKLYYYSLVKSETKRLIDAIFLFLYSRLGIFEKKTKGYVDREKKRYFAGWNPDEISVFSFRTLKYIYIYEKFECVKKYHLLPFEYMGEKIYKGWFTKCLSYIRERYTEIVHYDMEYGRDQLKDISRFRGDTRGLIHKLKIKENKNSLEIKMNLRILTFRNVNVNNLKIGIGNKEYTPEMNMKLINKSNFNEWKGECIFCIPYEDSQGQELQNKVFFIENIDGEINKIRIKYGRVWKFVNKLRPMRIYFDVQNNFTMFFRFPKDTLTLTIRDKNVTDEKKERMKVLCAYIFSKFLFWWKPILLFEKNASRYEESASVVYEKLVDKGYKNAYFVLDKNYEFWNDIPIKYRKNIIDKYSFKHYLCFFKTRSFIGSESKVHSFELRPISKLADRKLKRSAHNYVFLQHGVMYMVSLDSERRTFFRKNKNKKIKQRTVVSSDLEANHFIELGGYDPEDLYLSGLPKYDRNVWNETADKIVVMITWRPWEYIQSLDDIEKTSYFQMLKKIVEKIPKEYYDRLLVLPHPLVENQMRSENNLLKNFIPPIVKYDDILKETKILITDYSSISYDAFYRGCNVIFCWQEKNRCLEEYGKNAKLMLTPELAFGDINYDFEELPDLITKNYNKNQEEKYLDHYKKIVSFHDGNNTERLIEMMKKDKMI